MNQETISCHWVQPDFDGEDRLILGVHNQSSQFWYVRSAIQQTVDYQMMATEHGRDLTGDNKYIYGFE